MKKTYQFVLRVKREIVEEYTVEASSPEAAEEAFSRGEGDLSHEIDGQVMAVTVTDFDDGSDQRPVEEWPPAAASRRGRRPR